MQPTQAERFEPLPPTGDAVTDFSEADAASHGANHTKPEVADVILDLTGWDDETDLRHCRLLEPCVGEGDFFIPAVNRLLRQCRPDDLGVSDVVRAVEVSLPALAICRERLHALLAEHGWSRHSAEARLEQWIVHADFLTLSLETNFSHIVGNPPYLRLESLPKDLLRLYRARWRSLFDRADLYVAFFDEVDAYPAGQSGKGQVSESDLGHRRTTILLCRE